MGLARVWAWLGHTQPLNTAFRRGSNIAQEAYTVFGKLDGFVVAKCEADGDRCLVSNNSITIHHKN